MADARRAVQLPIQPVGEPILSGPYEVPPEHWVYDTETGDAMRVPGRRAASYWYKVSRSSTQQLALFAEEEREDLALVNALRSDVQRWRASGYEGATQVTKELLRHWWRPDSPKRLFYCQLEAAETIIFLNEIRLGGGRTRFRPAFTDEHLAALLDQPADPHTPPLRRLGVKMATGSGKTVVMGMLLAWSFCNRAKVRSDVRFPLAALVVCPNLTIKERLQVLRPESSNNYYDSFYLVPSQLRPLLNQGKVLVTNWHLFAPESEHSEGGQTYTVVNKGPEGDDAYARRILGDLYDHAPILVVNDEAHHAWRPPPETADVDFRFPESLTQPDRGIAFALDGRIAFLHGIQVSHRDGVHSELRGQSVYLGFEGEGQPQGTRSPVGSRSYFVRIHRSHFVAKIGDAIQAQASIEVIHRRPRSGPGIDSYFRPFRYQSAVPPGSGFYMNDTARSRIRIGQLIGATHDDFDGPQAGESQGSGQGLHGQSRLSAESAPYLRRDDPDPVYRKIHGRGQRRPGRKLTLNTGPYRQIA